MTLTTQTAVYSMAQGTVVVSRGAYGVRSVFNHINSCTIGPGTIKGCVWGAFCILLHKTMAAGTVII